ncbi:MAG TPA: methyltransferase domain-containing protein [Bryobacteraceae bacterium]|jgi:SAM-dependent methyltransferase|nr:methyltransferase domain-containing protein [Bryobacteraceae bacterium]
MKAPTQDFQELGAAMRRDWDQRAREDASFYVAFYQREQPEEAFHESGQAIVQELTLELSRLKQESSDKLFIRTLEIGCGPGRLMLPMSLHVDEIHGVDVSEEMVSIAAKRLADVPHAHVRVNNGYDLSAFSDEYFSFVYSFIVFQHIPSAEIVLHYLLETKRVLRPGGVTRFQVRGAPPSRVSESDSATWKGCVLSEEDIVDFARKHYLELVALSGVGTQYMWVTLRKPNSVVSGPTLEAVTGADGSSSVPQHGRGAALSLWLRNVSEGTDLTILGATINSQPVRGCYLSAIGPEGGCQMNLILPWDVASGVAEVDLLYKGVVLGKPKTIAIEAIELVPCVVAIHDAIDTTLLMESESGGMKILVENVSDPEQIRFCLGGRNITEVDIVSTNPGLCQFLFSILLPQDLSGQVKISVLAEDRELFAGFVKIAPPGTGEKQ